MDRKIVKAAQVGGQIWSPEHRRFLPAEGMEMEMSPYWLHLVERGDVAVADVPPVKAILKIGAAPEAPSDPTEPPAPAVAAPAIPAA